MKNQSALVTQRVLWLGSGEMAAQAKVTLYAYSHGKFELYTEKAGQLIGRYLDTLGNCVLRGELFINQLKSEGWTEDLPMYEPLPKS